MPPPDTIQFYLFLIRKEKLSQRGCHYKTIGVEKQKTPGASREEENTRSWSWSRSWALFHSSCFSFFFFFNLTSSNIKQLWCTRIIWLSISSFLYIFSLQPLFVSFFFVAVFFPFLSFLFINIKFCVKCLLLRSRALYVENLPPASGVFIPRNRRWPRFDFERESRVSLFFADFII